MSNYLNNDDDLFDYDPEQDEVKSAVPSYENNNAPKSDLYDNLKDHMDSDLEHIGNIDNGKIRFSTSYQHALSSFVNDTKSEASLKTISIVLNTLTNNDFNLMIMFHEAEMRISRRLIFLELSYRAFNEEEESIISLRNIGKLLNVDFSDLYINTCFKSTWNITEHAIKLDRALYLYLSERLGMPVKQYLFEEALTTIDHPHDVYLVDYRNKMHEEINDEIINNGFLQSLEKIFETNVTLVKSREEDL